MHKFTRGQSPVNMEKAKLKYHNHWDKKFIDSQEHTAISNCLYERQSHYCAYCETWLQTENDGFIEHLERRSDNPQRIFDWNNMFFSCKHTDSCGMFKDNTKQKFNPSDIVDPSAEEPLDFFKYDMNGGILPQDGEHKHRAEETIRVFNLNNARLTCIRVGIAMAISYFLQNNPSDSQINEFIQEMLAGDCPSVCESLLQERMA